MEKKAVMLLDYYQGAYGPTIRIDVQSVEALIKIKNLFLQLGDFTVREVNLVEIEDAKAIGLKQLILRSVPDNQESEKRLVLISNIKSGIIFEWAMSSKSWKKTAGLIDGLLEHGSSGHQYLTQEGVDDAIVELAFME